MQELLMYERITAFAHKLWSRYDLLGLYRYSPQLLEQHNRQLRTFSYSPIQDAYYALDGSTPNESPVGKLWELVLQTPQFEEARDLFAKGSLDSRANLVYWLGLVYENFIQPQTKKEDKKKDKGNAEKPNPDIKPVNLKDKDSSILADGNAFDQEPSDLEPDEGSNVGDGFTLKIPNGFKMPSLEEVKAQNETDEMMQHFMGTESGTPTEKRQVIEDFHKTQAIKNLAKFLGWTEQIVGAASRVSKGAVGFHAGFERGGWNGKVTAKEKRLVVRKNPMALMRFANNGLKRHIVQSNLPQGNGDIIVLRDQSGSMRDRGSRMTQKNIFRSPEDREQWEHYLDNPDKDGQAVNLELALAYHCQKQGRKLISVVWNSDQTRQYTYGEPGLMDHLNSFLGGGTSLNHALFKALDIAIKGMSDCPDILIETDGDISDNPMSNKVLFQMIADFRKKGGRIWCVLIGSSTRVDISSWVDGSIKVEDLIKGGKQLGELIKAMSVNRFKNERTNV